MSGFSGILKNGWHPDKDKPIKQQAVGLFKKDNNSNLHTPEHHVSRPLSSLRDPSSFGPPPRHVALGGGSSAGGSSSGAPSRSRSPPKAPPRPSAAPSLPARPGVSASRSSSTHDRGAAPAPDDEDEPPRAPRVYRVDTTGLNTAHLPPPPVRRDSASPGRTASPARGPTPNLPPRLPPRNTTPAASGRSAPPPLPARSSTASSRTGSVSPVRGGNSNNNNNPDNLINQAAVQRLGRAGIVVPGLGIGIGPSSSGREAGSRQQQQQPTPLAAIGSVAAARAASRETSPSRPSQPAANPQISELQARLAKMGMGKGQGAAETSSAKPPPGIVAAAAKKKPPPPPPKKPDVLRRPAARADDDNDDGDDDGPPPPIPMATRPQGW